MIFIKLMSIYTLVLLKWNIILAIWCLTNTTNFLWICQPLFFHFILSMVFYIFSISILSKIIVENRKIITNEALLKSVNLNPQSVKNYEKESTFIAKDVIIWNTISYDCHNSSRKFSFHSCHNLFICNIVNSIIQLKKI